MNLPVFEPEEVKSSMEDLITTRYPGDKQFEEGTAGYPAVPTLLSCDREQVLVCVPGVSLWTDDVPPGHMFRDPPGQVYPYLYTSVHATHSLVSGGMLPYITSF